MTSPRGSSTRGIARHCRVTLPSVPAIIIAAAFILPLFAAPVNALPADWHNSFDDGLRAAAESRKPIVVFVYIGGDGSEFGGEREHITLQGSRPRGRQLDSRFMLQQTLGDPRVHEAAKAFEPVLLDLRLTANDEARERLRVSPVVSEGADQRVGVYPITLFLDHNGDELFRRHGHLPPEAYELQLRRAAALFERLRAFIQDPADPVRLRELGRAYMEMDFTHGDRFYEAAVRNLEMAIERDPDNATGANFDARVDLTILRLPDDPSAALTDLVKLQDEDTDGARRLEIHYYITVAHYVLNNHAAAAQLLAEFETEDRDSPYFDSPWTSQALGLLQHIRQLQRR